MKLRLDTTNNLKTMVWLDQEKFVTRYNSPREQDVFGAIMTALERKQIELDQLREIEVATGPGSFTGIRVGISIAQGLGYAFSIPVNGIVPPQPIVPKYGKPASVTQ